jgi:crotonobetainyl-CoA:carnitine CoA-transferase CaiB-like acyl-CoA transferase
MGITGEFGRPPVRVGVAITDILAGAHAAIAILSALIARKTTGKGQWIDVSMLDGAVSWMTYMAANYFATGKVPERMGSAHPNIVPYQCFETKDGKYINIAIGNDRLWTSLCKVLGLKKLVQDPRFATNPKRVKNRNELISMLTKVFSTKIRDEWLEILGREIPCGPVYTMDEIFSDPQVLHRGMLVEIDHPVAGKIKQIGIPMKFSETLGEIKAPPPLLGQHTEEILKIFLKLSENEVSQLRKEKVI